MKLINSFICLLAFSLSINGCGSSSSQSQQEVVTQKNTGTTITPNYTGATLTQNDSGTTFVLIKDQIVTVSLHAYPSTGYLWEVVPGVESILPQQGVQYVLDSNLIGAGGTFTYTFKATALGTGNLKLIYRRPWETGVLPYQVFEINVVIVS